MPNIYAQIKKGGKLHVAYFLPNGSLTQPVCGQPLPPDQNQYRMTVNLPLSNACSKCVSKMRDEKFDENKFVKQYL